MYYYYCEKTGDSTWSYPSRQGITAAGPYATTSYGPMSQGPGNTTAPSAPASAPLDDYGYGRSNMMMWRADLGTATLSYILHKIEPWTRVRTRVRTRDTCQKILN